MAIGDLKAIKRDVDFASGMMEKAKKTDEEKKKEEEEKKKKKKKPKKKDEEDNENPWTKAFNKAMKNQSAGGKASGNNNEFTQDGWTSQSGNGGNGYARQGGTGSTYKGRSMSGGGGKSN